MLELSQLKLAGFLSKSNTEDEPAKQILQEPVGLFGCSLESEQHIPVSRGDGLEDAPIIATIQSKAMSIYQDSSERGSSSTDIYESKDLSILV